ncbi:hypothetical protein HDV03_004673 [Kappamyces sp. JEL0829]|nr:hypothetical protein HDV03_004673 [Kappamyces sp. JEL0829]
MKRYLQDVQELLDWTESSNATLLAPPPAASTGAMIARLKARNQESLAMLRQIKDLKPGLFEDIYSLNLGVSVLLDEFIAVQAKHQLVQDVDVIEVAVEAARTVRKEFKVAGRGPEIHIINVSGKPISTLYIRSHLLITLQELLRSSLRKTTSSPQKVTMMVAMGQEDISFRIEDEVVVVPSEKPAASQPPRIAKPVRPQAPQTSERSLGLARVFAKYWGGEVETVQMGNSVHSYLHLRKNSGKEKERIPPILETLPGDWKSMLRGSI